MHAANFKFIRYNHFQKSVATEDAMTWVKVWATCIDFAIKGSLKHNIMREIKSSFGALKIEKTLQAG